MTGENRRLFIGGLVKGVTEQEIVEKFSRFGQVGDVEVKTRATDTDSKIFAYVNLKADDNGFKKCFTAYNNTKWKGGQLKLQYAKENFLDKLKKEQAKARTSQKEISGVKPVTSVVKSPALDSDKKAVPGTPMDEKGTWVMGKYSRVLPVLHVRKPGSRKLVMLDPGKMTHCVKKLKSDDFDPEKSCDLTWCLEENTSDINKKRQGQFPECKAPKHQSTPKDPAARIPISSRLLGLSREERVSDTEMEVVPVEKGQTSSMVHADGGYDSDNSAGSADTDEIILKATCCKQKTSSSDNPLIPSPKSSGKKTKVGASTKESPAKRHEVDVKSAKAEKKQMPQFEFVKTPQAKLKGKAWKKSVKLNNTTASNGQSEEDSKNERGKTPLSNGKKKTEKTPEFKGLGMLLSDSEDDTPPVISSRIRNGVDENISEKQTEVKKARTVSPQNRPHDSVCSDAKNVLSSSKTHTAQKKEKAASVERFNLHKTNSAQEDTPQKSAKERSLLGGNMDEFGDGLETDSAVLKKQIRSKPVSSDDSDLDDNDFEKVGKKLADRHQQAYGRRSTVGKGPQATFPEPSSSPIMRDDSNMTRKNKTSQDGGRYLNSMNSMERSHQAFGKMKAEQKKKDSLITKALREGSGSKVIKFSASESESEEEEKSALEKPSRMTLFADGDGDSSDEADFSFKPQFEGNKGKKLFEMQCQMSDARFRFDERFESEDEDEEEEVEQDEKMEQDLDLEEERQRNQRILEKVLGYKPRTNKFKPYVSMAKRRYDPSSSDCVEMVLPKKRKRTVESEEKDPSEKEEDASEDKEDSSEDEENASEKEENASEEGENASEEGENTSEEEDSSEEEENASEEGENASEEGENASEEEDSSEEEVNASKEEENASKEEDSSEEEENASKKDENSSDEEDSSGDEEAEEESSEGEAAAEKEESSEDEDLSTEEEEEDAEKRGNKQAKEDSDNAEGTAVPDSSKPPTQQSLQHLFGGGGSFSFFGSPAAEEKLVSAASTGQTNKDEDDEEEDEISRAPERSVRKPTFMVSADDPRLEAAVKFFRRPPPEEYDNICAAWPEERRKTMKLVRERHKKALRKQRRSRETVKSFLTKFAKKKK